MHAIICVQQEHCTGEDFEKKSEISDQYNLSERRVMTFRRDFI